MSDTVDRSDRTGAYLPGRIEVVDRLDDPRVAAYAHVGDVEWLQSHRLFVAEGRLVVRRLIEERRFAIHSLLLTPAAHEALADAVASAGAPVYICGQQALNAITGFNFHRGCLALAERGQDGRSLEALLGARLLVGLEGVGNPDNVGGIFRSALALGAGGVVLDRTSGDPLYRKAIRTSMGAALHLPYARIADWVPELNRIRAAGFTIIALTPAPDAMDIRAYAASRRPGPLLLLAGHEGHGLTATAIAASDVRCRIPVEPRSDSLNVAVAVAVALALLTTDRA